MSFRRLGSRVRNIAQRRHDRQRTEKRLQSRHNLVQQLEDRRLLAGPELIAIRPDAGALLRDGDTLNIAPREFNLQFKAGADLDESTINNQSVKLVRAGGDGNFDDGNEVDVVLGYVGLEDPGNLDPTNLQRIVFRTASSASHNDADPAVAFPDDLYQIQVLGSGPFALTNLNGESFNDGVDLTTTFTLDRGAQVVAVVPQPISQAPFTQASDTIEVFFDDQLLNPAQVVDPSYYRLVDTGASLSDADDMTLLPESVSYDADANKVTLKFESDLPEGTYRLDVGLAGQDNSIISDAINVGTLSSGSSLTHNGFLGDAGGMSNNAGDIDLYELDLQAGSTLQVDVDPHVSILNLRVRLLDAAENELVSVNPGSGITAVINFPIAVTGAYYLEVTSEDGTTGSYRISASATGNPISLSDDNSTFRSATGLGKLGSAGVRVTSDIRPQGIPLPPRTGSDDEPGHRQIQREMHTGVNGTTPELPSDIRVITYYFPETVGENPSGADYLNLITEKEKQIVREALEVYAQVSGIEFIESTETTLQPIQADFLLISKGDLRAFDPTLPPNSGVAGLGGPGGVILNAALFNQSNRFYGDGFSEVMFHEIGHALGLGHAYDLPANLGAPLPDGTPNNVIPGDHDVVHLQRIAPPNSTDIDMYEFTVTEPGRLTAETVAERLATPSLLNTALTLYRSVGTGYELIARNDQYFGADSFIDLHLEPGTYFVGVSSTGNTSYDPRVPDSGFGGTTDGIYDLVLNFESDDAIDQLTDAQGTDIDGDGDGTAGGVFSFWFQASDVDTTVFVSKITDTTGGPEGSGSLADPYDTIEFALQQAGNRIVVPVDGATSIAPGESFTIDDGVNLLTLPFGVPSTDPIDISTATTPEEVAQAIESAINNAVTAGRLSTSVTVSVSGRVVQLGNIDNLDVTQSPTLLKAPNIVHLLADGGLDSNVDTLADNSPYLVGFDVSGNALPDGAEFLVPQGVNVMIQAGALLKMRRANLDAGSSSANISRSHSSIQVLGVPGRSVYLRSYHNDSVGGDSDGVGPAASSGDFGGIVYRDDSDMEEEGIFLNSVNHADIQNGGGNVFVDANELPFAPIYMVDSRPAVSFNQITSTDGPAISASPDSFEDSLGRIGPDVVGNYLSDNKIDGMFIRVKTPLGSTVDKLDGSGRLDDTDITHVLSETLIVAGGAGGPVQTPGGPLTARPSGRLVVDPGLVFKLDTASIEVERGGGALIAEGNANSPIIFTSIADDRFGGSGSFNTDPSGNAAPAAGDWGGLYFGHATSGSIDHAFVAYAGGTSSIEGGEVNYNALEIHQAKVRLTNSTFQSNADGIKSPSNGTDGPRNGRGQNAAAVIYVRGAQPIIVDNTIINNDGPAININANSLRHEVQRDSGRTTGAIQRLSIFDDNRGPLIRFNELDDNAINGLSIRGQVLTTESVWDDTDIVHVINGEVIVGNHHAYSGLRLQSSNSESLVVKVAPGSAGITATGTPREIDDRIGGTIHILGTVGHPVVLTSLTDDSVGAGFTPGGELASNTNNSSSTTTGVPGAWRGLLLDEWSNDQNVAIIRELENPLINGVDVNFNPSLAQKLGVLAPNEKGGDENRRLGFEVKGFISPTNPDDVDVYSFIGTAGTEIWLDIDRTDSNLDAIIEVVNATGTVLARSIQSATPNALNADENALTERLSLGGDHYSQNFRDPGMRYVLPGTPGNTGTYFIRVRSNPVLAGNIESLSGDSRGEYQLQIRLNQVQDFPGSTIRFSDIRYATTGIDVRGLPARSPIIGEAGELAGEVTETYATAQQLVNLLETDMAALSISGRLAARDEENNGVGDGVDDGTDVDWYSFNLDQTGIQVIGGVNDGAGTIGVVFDIDYADGAVRADTTIAVYDDQGNLVYVGRESNIDEDQPINDDGSIGELSRGSLGKKDAYIGPIHLQPGTNGTRYYVAVMSDRQIPSALNGVFQAGSTNALTRLEPVNSVVRIVEDHLGFQGYTSQGLPILPTEAGGLFDISSSAEVGINVKPFTLEDVVLYVATDQPENDVNRGDSEELFTASPYESSRWLTRVTKTMVDDVDDIQDIAIRTDGRMYGYQRLNDPANVNAANPNSATVGALVEINPEDGSTSLVGNDNIPGMFPTPNSSIYSNDILNRFGREKAIEQVSTSEFVDALAFKRLDRVRGTSEAPIPRYDIFYVVRESETSSKLYRASEDGDATLRRAVEQLPGGDVPTNYGVAGYITPAGVTFETYEVELRQPVQNAPDPITNIRLRAKTGGAAGAFELRINPFGRPNNLNVDVDVVGNVINLTVGGTGNPIAAAPSAQAIVDALNSDADARELMVATIFDGNANNRGDGNEGTAAIVMTPSLIEVGDAQSLPALRGRVTGISFANWDGTGNLFGVTNEGEFLEIDPGTGIAVNVVDAANTIGIEDLNFQGLTLGPQNVEGGIYKNTLFAVTDTGQLVAFDTNGNGEMIFASGGSSQLLTAGAGQPGGTFTLTTDATSGGFIGRNTTDPLHVDAPAFLSVNETQLLRTVGEGSGGTFRLSFVDDVAEVTSPRFGISAFDTAIQVQDVSGFPATPFVIQIENEQMRVNSVVGNTFNVTRGINGTALSPHSDTTTITEVRTTPLMSSLSVPESSSLSGAIDATTTTLSVADASSFPVATPFTIRVENEEMRVTAVVGNDLTVVRGVNSTGAIAHRDGRTVEVIDDSLMVLDPSHFPAVAPFNLRIGNEDLRVVSVVGNLFNVIRGVNGTTSTTHSIGSTVANLQTTSSLAYDATNSQIQAALSALPGIGFGNVLVTDGPLTGEAISRAVKVEFVGDLARHDLQPLTGDNSQLIGDEIQEIELDQYVVGGTFRLSFQGEETVDLSYNVTAADLQNALLALPSVGPNDFIVTGTDLADGSLFVQFSGDLQDQNVASLVVTFEDLVQTEIQQIQITGNPNGGDFTLDINDPTNSVVGSSDAIANTADAAAVQTALESGIPALAGNIEVTGGALPGGTILIRFINGLGGLDMQRFTVTNNLTGGLTPTVVVTEILSFNANPPAISELRRGLAVEVPVLTQLDGRLSVKDALEALPNFAVNDIVAAGVMQPPGTGINITFGGAFSDVNVPLLEVDNSLNNTPTDAMITAGGSGSPIMEVSGMVREGAFPIGLAFSPLDFNLWHPTTRRGEDAGHGVNDTDDRSRDPSDESVLYATPDVEREFDEDEGAISYHFGLEPWVSEPDDETLNYIRYIPGVNAQYGILTTEFHQDLSSNEAITNATNINGTGEDAIGTYNLPGGAVGTLTTNTFDLADTDAEDRPTLYFNYFLETESHGGSNLANDPTDPFRDSARVYISKDGGTTWELVATNSSLLSGDDPDVTDQTAELPGFLSHLSDAGLNSLGPRSQGAQIVQELHDNTGQWRQARVDLSMYAGFTGLMMRVDFSTAGSMNDGTLGRDLDGIFTPIDAQYDPEDDPVDFTDDAPYGEFVSRDNTGARSIRSLQNQFEGFYIDDFIIGYTERGEMVTGATGDTGITNLFANDRTRDDDPDQFADITFGEYQLEIRRTGEHIGLVDPETFIRNIYATNDKHTNLVDETTRVTFEPSTAVPDLTPTATTLLGGFSAAEITPWFVSTTNPDADRFSTTALESGPLGANDVAIFEATAAELGSTSTEEGVIRFSFSVQSMAARHGLRFFIDGVEQTFLGKAGQFFGDHAMVTGQSIEIDNGIDIIVIDRPPTEYEDVEFPFSAGNPTFTWVFDQTNPNQPGNLSRAFIDNIVLEQGGSGLLADRNRERPQGTLILDSNFITDSLNVGVNVEPGTAQGQAGTVPHQGATIFYPQYQPENDALIPGIVIQNNVIAGSSGIRFAGENSSSPQRPVPFGRIVNNTLVGDDNQGIGIQVAGLASPTLMNNLINDYNIAIEDGALNPIIRANFFQDNNNQNVTGTTPIIASASAQLFLDKANGNYYLSAATAAIDSSQNTEQDRFDYLTFKTELGISASPINSPDRDVFGQLRVDPNASPLGDRGAVERTDGDAPYATLLNPIDNDAEGNDRDPSETVVMVTNRLLENFTILLGDGRGPNSPFEGTGVNGLTVDDPSNDAISARAVVIEQNGVELVQGVDYILAYNELSGVLRLTPLSTLWEPDSVYVITLDNTLIVDRAGNRLRSNQVDGSTRFTIIIPDVDIDYGDSPDTYRTLLVSNGARHTVNPSRLPVLGSTVDGDIDGQPSVGAIGDDNDLNGPDEDGLYVGTFVGPTTTTEGLFLFDSAPDPTSVASDVVAFLDRNDPAGAVLPVTVTGTGVLDAWIDFNGDGDFVDFGEKAISGVNVVDGVNHVRVFTPANAVTGMTYARFRISEEGTAFPHGLVVGGEVEDYHVNIVDVNRPVIGDDTYSVNEDEVLTIDGSSGTRLSLIENDTLPSDEFVSSQVVIEGTLVDGTTDTYKVTHGTVRVDNASLGHVTYTPDGDYYGVDTFRYRVSTQRNDGPVADAVGEYGTVTINIAPVNDAPGVMDTPLTALEYQPNQNPADQVRVIMPSELLVTATADADIQLPTAPFDESNQIDSLRVISISYGGVTIDKDNPSATVTTSQGGTVTAEFDTELADPADATTRDRTFITRIFYQGADYFNSDNVRADADPRLLDLFTFTIEDDGRSLDDNGDPIAGDPLTATANANITVAPQNSFPEPATDVISRDDARYRAHYVDQGLNVPVPTEDQSLLIPSTFLIENDRQGPSNPTGLYGADDEVQPVNGNDGPLRIIDVSVDPFFGTIELDSSGNVLFTPADDIYGQVEFQYTVEDLGVDESMDGTRVINPLRTTMTSTIVLEPVNDVPVAYDRSLGMTEGVEPAGPAQLTFTADDLLNGAGSVSNSPIVTTGGSIQLVHGNQMVDGETLVLTDTLGRRSVIEFSLSTTRSVGTDVLVTYSTSDSAADIAANLTAQLRAAGLGGIDYTDRVELSGIVSAVTSTYSAAATASAAGISVPDGASIVGGEVITITDTKGGVTTVELSTSGVSITGADLTVVVGSADDAATVAAAIKSTLMAVGIGSIDDPAPPAGREAISFSATTVAAFSNPGTAIVSTVDGLVMPDAASLNDGEFVVLNNNLTGSMRVEFNTTGLPSPGTDLVVRYNNSDSAADLASNLESVLRSVEVGIAAAADGSVSFAAISDASVAAPMTSIVAASDLVIFPAGDQLIDGERLTLTDGGGTQTVVEFSSSTTASAGTDVLVTYFLTDTPDDVAAKFRSQLEAAGFNSIVATDTVILPVVTAASTSTFAAGTNASAVGLGILVADASMLTEGEVISVTASDGSTTTIELSTRPQPRTNADIFLTFAPADSAQVVLDAVQSALMNLGIGSVDSAGPVPGVAASQWTAPSVASINDGASAITATADLITIPDVSSLIDGETITIADGLGGTMVVEFNTTGVAAAGTDVVVQYDAGVDSAASVASDLAGVMRAAELGATDNGDGTITLKSVTAASVMVAVTAITVNADLITLPDAQYLIDGETVTLTVDGNDVVIEFNQTGVASANTDYVVRFGGGEPANVLAADLVSQLAADGYGVMADGDSVRFSNSVSIVTTELPDVPGDFDATLPAPYDESEQELRVVYFATSEGVVQVASGYTGTQTLMTSAGGTLTLDFVDGAFTTGVYEPPVDYNRLPPFQPSDLFTYRISDDGQTTMPVTGEVRTLPEEQSILEATVTITVEPANDAPFIEHEDQVDILEDPSPAEATIPNVFTTVLPAPPSAGDELVDQGRPVVTSIVATDPANVMMQLPDVTDDGGLTVYPNADAVGEVVYVVTFTDDHPTDPQSTNVTLTVNVRAVNDAPRFDPAVANTGEVNNSDDAYSVGGVVDPNTGLITDATITYTLREDNSQPVGQPAQPYFIPFNRDTGVSGYNPVGLLDVFTVGPANEADTVTEGGNQSLSIGQVPPRTNFGGTLTVGVDSFGNPGVFYTPPRDFNNLVGTVDSFTYTVTDDGTTWQTDQLVSDPQSSANTVEFVLIPVNDKPQFGINLPPADSNDPTGPLRRIEALEDGDVTLINNFVFGVDAGPPSSAFDEVNAISGQNVTFNIAPLDFNLANAGEFFAIYPTISDAGALTFQPASNAFGRFSFEITLMDDGASDASRGDQNLSDPRTITIDVLPINDPPVLKPGAMPLDFTIDEDSSVDIFTFGNGSTPGLLDVFIPGPANESSTITPGGNQTVSLKDPLPTQSTLGGAIVPIIENNVVIGLQYTPRANFVGVDTFTYTVTDDGVTVDFGTDLAERFDPRVASNTVTIDVKPINNPPQFSGPSNVEVFEDAGDVSINNWSTNVLAGPPTATDEIETQGLFFTITQLTGESSLFASPPVAVIDSNLNQAALQFRPADDANGVATFEVQLFDQPTDGTPAMSSSVRTFTLTINPVNDPPTFDRAANPVSVDEDSGPYSETWATNIFAGASDETSQSVRFEVSTPAGAESLFQQLPTISDDGTLRFLPANNANGSVDLTVTAFDSGNAPSRTEVLRIVINPVNDVPVAVADTASTNEDSVLVIGSAELLANDSDADIGNPSDSLSVKLQEGGFSLSGASVSFDQSTGQITYDPTTSVALQSLGSTESTVDSFTYRAVDASGAESNIVTVAVTVQGVNDAPVARNDSPTLNPDGPTVISVLENDTDIDGDLVLQSVEVTFQPTFGTVEVQPDGRIIFVASQQFRLEDTFRYRVRDNEGAFSEEATVTIQANAAPVARDDQAATFLEEAVVINVAANDFDPDANPGAPNGGLDLSSIQLVDAPLNGQVIPLGDGTVRYIPTDGFIGLDTFSYTIADAAGRMSSPGEVQVQVIASRLQNPSLRYDVNDDGNVSPIDALLVINALARSGSGSIPVEDTDAGPPFTDVNGDQLVTPLDALSVINELARRSSSANGEQVEGEQVILDEVSGELESPLANEFVDLLANSRDDDDSEDDDRLKALDVAFGDLM